MLRYNNHMRGRATSVELWDCSGDPEYVLRMKTHKTLAKAPQLYTSLDQEPEIIRGEFDQLLMNSYNAMMEMRDREEKSIAGEMR
eukprot:jgi/Hompol1/1675/HPOL_004881-RA